MFLRQQLYTTLNVDHGQIEVRKTDTDEIVMELSVAAAEDLSDNLQLRAEEGRRRGMAEAGRF